MAYLKINARDWGFEIADDADSLTEIAGVNTMTIGVDTQEADTTDFDSDGDAESEPMQRGETYQLQGFRLEDPDTGLLQPGQRILDTLGRKVAAAAVRQFSATAPGGTTYTMQGWVRPGNQGGGNNDKHSLDVTLVRSGATTVNEAGS